MQAAGLVQGFVMSFDEGMHFAVGGGITQNRRHGKEQDLPKLVTPTLLTTMIFDLEQETLQHL